MNRNGLKIGDCDCKGFESFGYTIACPPHYSYLDVIWNHEDPENWLTIRPAGWLGIYRRGLRILIPMPLFCVDDG